MQATPPYPNVPGDNAHEIFLHDPTGSLVGIVRERLMARSHELIGFTSRECVWRFGFMPNSEAANAYKVAIDDGEGFLWVLATRKTGKVKATFRGYALELPHEFRRVIDG